MVRKNKGFYDPNSFIGKNQIFFVPTAGMDDCTMFGNCSIVLVKLDNFQY